MKIQKMYQAKLIGLMFMILVLVGSFSVKQEALSYGNDDYSGAGGAAYGTCNYLFIMQPIWRCDQLFSQDLFCAVAWMISPVGIIFFWSLRLISKKTSKLKRSISWIGQILALFIWHHLWQFCCCCTSTPLLSCFRPWGMFLIPDRFRNGVFRCDVHFCPLWKSIEYSADRAGSGGREQKWSRWDRGGKSHEGIKIAGIEFTGLKTRSEESKRRVKEISMTRSREDCKADVKAKLKCQINLYE